MEHPKRETELSKRHYYESSYRSSSIWAYACFMTNDTKTDCNVRAYRSLNNPSSRQVLRLKNLGPNLKLDREQLQHTSVDLISNHHLVQPPSPSHSSLPAAAKPKPHLQACHDPLVELHDVPLLTVTPVEGLFQSAGRTTRMRKK